jgi:hypothetical protein
VECERLSDKQLRPRAADFVESIAYTGELDSRVWQIFARREFAAGRVRCPRT